MPKNLLIWNGEFSEVPEDQARKMAAEGACQIMDELDGENLKFAHEFTKSSGYMNKAMATEIETKPEKVEKSAKPEKPADDDKPSYGTLRKMAAEYFDKSYMETTKDDVAAFQEATNETA